MRSSMGLWSFLTDPRTWGGVRGEYAVEMPVHLLRALYVRDYWGVHVPDLPHALGVSEGESRPESPNRGFTGGRAWSVWMS